LINLKMAQSFGLVFSALLLADEVLNTRNFAALHFVTFPHT